MISRRRALLACAGAIPIATAGCLDFVTGDGPIERSAKKALPSDSALDETGYEERESGWEEQGDTIEFASVERDVEIDVWTAAYAKTVEIEEATIEGSAFGLVSTPNEEVAGESLNPLADMSEDEVLEEVKANFGSEYDDLRDIEREGTETIEILDEDRDVAVYGGTTEHEDAEYEVALYLSLVEHDDDILVLIGAHPKELPDERENVETLMASVEHPVDD